MIFESWTEENTKKFREEAFIAEHKLLDTGLFSDEALIALLDKHPKSHLDVCTMGNDPVYPNKFRTGDAREADGATLMEASKSGDIWINMRHAMNFHPEYKRVLDKIYGDLAKVTGRKPFTARGAILISSPSAIVPYHCDSRETILWHIRGHKKFYLYPPSPKHLPDHAYEKTLFDIDEDLPYTPDMEDDVEIFDLMDQQMITWPLNAPHRVENVTHCVSVSTEYSSRESSFKNAVMYTNAVMRQRLNKPGREWAAMSKPEKVIKAGLGRCFRKLGLLDQFKSEDFVDFMIDKNRTGFIRDIEPVIRNF